MAEYTVAERRLIRACEVANEDLELLQIEHEFDALRDEISEPWDEPDLGE